jgi:hypothetical protein
MSGGRPAVDKYRPIIEDATRAGEPDSASRLPPRRDVNSAPIGLSLAETAETLRRFPVATGISFPALIGASLAEIAEIAEIPSKAPGGDQRLALQGFAGSIHAGR